MVGWATSLGWQGFRLIDRQTLCLVSVFAAGTRRVKNFQSLRRGSFPILVVCHWLQLNLISAAVDQGCEYRDWYRFGRLDLEN